MLNAAKVFSFFFHPLLMTSFGILLIFSSGINLWNLTFEQKRAIFLIIFSGTFLLPICFIPLFLLFRMIGSVQMNSLKERLLPLFFTLVVYFFTYLLIYDFLPEPIFLFMKGVVVSVAVVFLVSTVWKISAHMVGIGGLAGLVLSLSFTYSVNLFAILVPVILVAGLTGFSRIELKAHNPRQVYSGFLAGAAIMIMVFYIF